MFKLQKEMTSAGIVWVASGALRLISKEADLASPLESGGVLLGYWSESPHGPVVTHAVGPGPNAKHFRDRFVPDYEFHEAEIARLYTEYSGMLDYLGDWHSHPGSDGTMSISDRKTLFRIGRSRQARAPRPLMLIMAFGPKWSPVAWTATRSPGWSPCRSFVVENWNVASFDATN